MRGVVRIRVAILLLALAGPIGAAFAAESVKDLAEGLRDPRRWNACYRELLARKDPRAIPHLLRVLPELNATVQYCGVVILSRYPPKVGDPALRELAHADDPHLRVTAGAVLLGRGEDDVAIAVADALITEGLPAERRVLLLIRARGLRQPLVLTAIRSLVYAAQDERVVARALYCLHLAGDSRGTDAARRWLAAPVKQRPWTRAVAAAFMLRFGDDRYAAVLAKPLREGSAPKEDWVFLHAYLGAARFLPPEVLDALAASLEQEKVDEVAREIIALLAKHRHRGAADALRKRLRDGETDVATAAFDALLEIPGALGPDRLVPLLDAKRPEIRLRAADALRRYDDPAGFATAVGLLREGEPAHRAEAARIVGGFRRSAAVGPLVEALLDEAPRVRAAALAAATDVLLYLFPYRRLNLASTGYDPKAAPEANAAAVETIRAWWRENRAEDW